MFELVVNHPFAHYTVGQRISDPHEVETILASHHRNFVVKVAAPGSEVSVPDPAPAAAHVDPTE